MAPRTVRRRLATLLALAPGLLVAGCFDEPPIETGVPVFVDTFGQGFTPNAFEGSLLTALSVDESRARSGEASIRLTVPSPGYAGGAVLTEDEAPQDLTRTDALLFWATASRDATFDEIGFGLNFDPFPSTYRAALFGLPLTTEWTRHAIPIPDPSRLTAERGMLHYVDEDATSYTAWLDDVRFDRVDAAALALEPSIATATRALTVGGTVRVPGLSLRYTDLDGTRRSVDSTAPGSGPAPAYFSFASSNPSVATVDADGLVRAVQLGRAVVTARLQGRTVPGALTVDVVAFLPTEPAAAPPAPTVPAADVISLLSTAYPNVPVDTWRTAWSSAVLTDVTIGGDPVKRYSALDFVGVEFTGANLVDASAMDAFHVDVWTADATTFRVKLVDFGADATIGGGDDSEHELAFDAATSPALEPHAWVSLDLPFASFANLTDRAHLGQLIFSAQPAGAATVYVDNVYFHR